ncbi:hypothetical protein [Amycolatopsis nigrescens]|uniref:hypothetical protein n=1 Tax=Amycolatopsis nigrescens TaxID=381445 RepID=UPI000364F5BC|nr:hypothetical protein [Amycolatopsis nigrescens]
MVAEQTEDQVKPVQRIAGPMGFLLVLLLFLLLPNVAASCSVSDSAAGQGEVAASFTGADLVTAGDPGLEATGAFEMSSALVDVTTEDAAPGGVVRGFAIAAVVAIGLGLAGAFVQVWRLRAVVTLTVAAVAALLLATTEILIIRQWAAVAESFAELMTELPDARGIDIVGKAREIVQPGVGFWLSLAGLVAIAATNLILLIRHRDRPEQLPQEDGVSDR